MLNAETIAWVAMGIGIIGCSGATLILSRMVGESRARIEELECHADASVEEGHGTLV